MFAVRLEFLTGRYVATRHNDRTRAEWPPHPGRFFSALVNAWAEGGCSDSERSALEWLEAQPSPVIAACAPPLTIDRQALPVFVADNDVTALAGGGLSNAYEQLLGTGPGEALERARAYSQERATRPISGTEEAANKMLQILPGRRLGKERAFPVVVPDDPVVHFSWPDAEVPRNLQEGLERVVARVHRLGHSSSFVHCRIVDTAPAPTYIPDNRGDRTIRVTASGLLAALVEEYGNHQGIAPRSLPAAFQRYRITSSSPGARRRPESHFQSDWLMFQLNRPAPQRAWIPLARAVRGAIMRFAAEPIPEVLSGHARGTGTTGPSTSPHVAIVPVPYVGSRYSDGDLRGVAFVMPRGAQAEDHMALHNALLAWSSAEESGLLVNVNRSMRYELLPHDAGSVTASFAPGTWSRPAKRWASVSPIALDRAAGDLWSDDPARREKAEARARSVISRACVHIGLPSPVRVEVDKVSAVRGVRPSNAMPLYSRGANNHVRQTVHAEVEFDQPVSGPVLLGAGRYFGYGLCRPIGNQARSAR